MRAFRRGGQQPIFKRPRTNSRKILQHIKSVGSLQLPSIYSKSLKMKIPEISLQSSNDVRRQLSKAITFTKQKSTTLQGDIYSMLPEDVKGVVNSAEAHKESILLVNKIFSSCDIALKEKDILLMEGKKSQAKYVLVNSIALVIIDGIYKPKSVCCQITVVIKCIEKIGIDEGSKMTKKLHLICLGCKKIILKFIEKEGSNENVMQKKRKLLDFALHIASGRYKRHTIQQTPINSTLIHVKSRISQHIQRGIQSIN